MNISVDRLEANDGSGLEERPDYVRGGLDTGVECGHLEGRPVVSPPDGRPEHVPLGSDVSHLYDHYPDNLLHPSAGSFLHRLFESDKVGSLSDAAEELNTDVQTVERAAQLHGLESCSEGDDETDGDSDDAQLSLPSGETVEFGPRHPLVLAQLLSDGLSFSEAARYLSRETGERVTESDVRQAAQEYNLLGGGGSSKSADPIPPEKRTVTADDSEDYARTPW